MTTLTVEEAAALVRVSPWTIHKWVQRGHLRPVRITTADRMRFIEDEVVECAVARRSKRESARLERLARQWDMQTVQ